NTLQQRPNDPTLYYYLAVYQARAKLRDDAIASLTRTLELGEGFLPTDEIGFHTLGGDPAYTALHAKMAQALPVVADAPVAFRLSDKTLIPEGIAYDSKQRHFYIGSIAQKRILKVDAQGRATPFSRDTDGLQHVLGLAVDSNRRALYAVSTNAFTKPATVQNAIVRYDLESGVRTAVFEATGAQQLNDVTLAPNGDVYASDSGNGGIWRLTADGKIAPFLPPRTLPGANGLAVSNDGKILYVGHASGVARVDLATGKPERMAPPARQTVAAIDGLYLWNGDLLGIQNVTNPGRVIRMRLDPAGREIVAVDTLQSHHHRDFREPTTGVVAEGAFYVLATTQVGEYGDDGKFKHPDALLPPAVVRIALPR
ncbi:MAG TPA: SMP-30/gluconolactonase/LRE family protein, partial [Burkholderiaceae bacterium]